MRLTVCPCCSSPVERCAEPWRVECPRCAYEGSELEPTINAATAHALIDEGAREVGLKEVRVRNFATLVDVLVRLKPAGGRLLDVGAAHGWFIEAARSRFDASGVEPDEAVFRNTVARGLPLRNGYFPDVLAPGEMMDVIVFNDVIEHIPDIDRILQACRDHLRKDGVLLLNLPNSGGVFYRAAKVLARLGVPSFLDRLWQKGLPSPHVHYFDPDNLRRLLTKNAFEPVASGRLSTLRYGGLWTRISYTGDQGLITRIVLFAAIAIAIPVLRLFPSDIIYVAARPRT